MKSPTNSTCWSIPCSGGSGPSASPRSSPKSTRARTCRVSRRCCANEKEQRMALKNFGIQHDDSQSPATTRLRAMPRSGTMVVAPFVLNAFHARIAEAVGFQVVYMTGFGTAAERGYPDVGLVTQTEMVENARYMASAVDVPVLCDADTGYGNPLNVTRTIREYEAAGVAGCHIEDQVFPKKCGFFAGKQVVPLEEHVQKIQAALAARRDPDFVIIARTHALPGHGWDEVIRRCRTFHQAGPTWSLLMASPPSRTCIPMPAPCTTCP